MKRQKNWVVLAASVLLAAPAMGVVDNASIDSAGKEYQRLFEASRQAGDRPGQADMGDFTDQALAKIPVEELTLDQVQRELNLLPVMFSTKTSAAMIAYLDKRSQSADAEGGRAAILQLELIASPRKADDEFARLQAVLAHPGLKAAVAKGYGTPLFEIAADLSPDGMRAVQLSLVDLKGSITAEAPPSFYEKGAAFLIDVAKSLGPEGAKAYAPLREQLAVAAQEKLKGNVPAESQPRLQKAAEQLSGAYASGTLVGSKAPSIDFLWFEDPSDPKRTIHSLDDLKGKVVVLDFWATWCGPCRATFPKVKALSRYYRGYDVVVLGVTSLQGYHNGPNGRIDTTGDPQKEFALMADFIKEQDITWPIAFSKQPVFNPEYGVTGIPDVMIIDPAGIVRYAGLHPAAELSEKTAMIDPLLSEAKLNVPALLMMEKPKTAEAQ